MKKLTPIIFLGFILIYGAVFGQTTNKTLELGDKHQESFYLDPDKMILKPYSIFKVMISDRGRTGYGTPVSAVTILQKGQLAIGYSETLNLQTNYDKYKSWPKLSVNGSAHFLSGISIGEDQNKSFELTRKSITARNDVGAFLMNVYNDDVPGNETEDGIPAMILKAQPLGSVGIGMKDPGQIMSKLHVLAPSNTYECVGLFESKKGGARLGVQCHDNDAEIVLRSVNTLTKKAEDVVFAGRAGGNAAIWVPGANGGAGGDAFTVARDGTVAVGPNGATFGRTLGVDGTLAVGQTGNLLHMRYSTAHRLYQIMSEGPANGIAFILNGRGYNNEVMRLRPDGRVGIGTSYSPVRSKLHVRSSSDTDECVGLFESKNVEARLGVQSYDKDAEIILRSINTQTNKPEDVVFAGRAGGNAAIWVPGANEGKGGDAFTVARDGKIRVGPNVHTLNSTLNVGGTFSVGQSGKYLNMAHNATSDYNYILSAGAANGLCITLFDGKKSSDAMRFRQNGWVGVGISDPEQNLHVKDTIAAQGLLIGTTVGVPNTVMTIDGAVYISRDDKGKKVNPAKKWIPEYSLWVEDGIVTDDIAIVDPDEWSDYVFEEDYELISLDSLEQYVREHKHLPNIPSEAEVMESGYTVNTINVKLLEKIEELTLYTISQQKEIARLRKLEERLEAIESRLAAGNVNEEE